MSYTHTQVLSALAGHEIGGGTGYIPDYRVRERNATVTVRTRSQFTRYAGDSNAVIWIPGDERIDLSGWSGNVRATIASDRGQAGSPGALLYTTDHGQHSDAWDGGVGRGVMQFRSGARLTGVRLRGPYHDHYDDPRYPGYIPLDSGDRSERRRKRQARYARGINVQGRRVEIDNCELYGWPNEAINIGSSSRGYAPHIHHVYGHDCMMVGYGYVVDIIKGDPLIEDSYFNATRHSIDGFGYPECSYRARNCVFGPITYSHAVDMHCLSENGFDGDLTAGGRVEVSNCTFAFTHNIRGNWAQAIAFRGYPEGRYITENCRFLHEIDGEEPPENVGNKGYQPVPYRQVNVGSGWHDWEFRNNQYGPDAPYRPGIGASINLDDPERPSIPDGLSPRRRLQILRGLEQTEQSLLALRDYLTLSSND